MATQDPQSYADRSQGQIKHIDLKIHPDFSSKTFEIEARYQLDRPVSGSFYLDTHALDIRQASAGGQPLEWELDEEHALIGRRLHLKNLDSLSEFTLAVNTSPEAQALQWTDSVQTAGGEHPFLFSQCQSIHARSLFPCQDTPSVRFTYTAEIQAPLPLTAVMAAENTGVHQQGEGRIFHFRMPQAIPSYLFALAIANLEFREVGPRTGIYAEPETIEAAAWEFADMENMVVEAEKLLGPYLWDRFDALVLPPSFPYGGMENPRLTFLTPTLILGNRSQTGVVIHELAHSWTGNLVTNATWEHIWLNEGWTTYAEMRIREVLEGVEEAKLEDAYYAARMVRILDQFGWDSEITQLRQFLTRDSNFMSSQIPYFKGRFFLGKIEEAVGRERFDEFIQVYMQRYQFQSLTSEEFLAFMEAELPGIGEKVDIQQWIYQPGLPEGGDKAPSELYDQVLKAVDGYKNGALPTEDRIAAWSYGQKVAFLEALPKEIPLEDCRKIDELFDLKNNPDGSALVPFFVCSLNAGDEAILPRVEEFLGRIGRMLYINPLYQALFMNSWSQKHGKRIFEQNRSRYHPIAAGLVDRRLKEAGL